MTAALFYCPPQLAAYYRRCRLDEQDQARLAQNPQLVKSISWQTSRVGKHLAKQYYPQGKLCLSHKDGHSLIAVGTGKTGVDLEYLRQRDYLALAEKTCSAEEIRRLRHLEAKAQQELFYRLWTVKEALIKGQNLRFPSDMPAIGFTWKTQESFAENITIRSPSPRLVRTWLSAALAPDWYFAALWFEPVGEIALYSPIDLNIHDIIGSSALEIKYRPLSLAF